MGFQCPRTLVGSIKSLPIQLSIPPFSVICRTPKRPFLHWKHMRGWAAGPINEGKRWLLAALLFIIMRVSVSAFCPAARGAIRENCKSVRLKSPWMLTCRPCLQGSLCAPCQSGCLICLVGEGCLHACRGASTEPSCTEPCYIEARCPVLC